MNRKLILIRHAITTAQKNTLVGKSDFPLSEEGKKQAESFYKKIQINNPAVKLYVSNMIRARQTAEIIFPGLKFQADARINEVDFGKWSNMHVSDISKNYPEAMDEWCRHPLEFRFPEGESVGEFIHRIKDFLDSEILNYEENSLVVCHGGVIRFMICRMLNIDYSHHLAFEVHRPSVNIIDHDGKTGVLTGLNITGIIIE